MKQKPVVLDICGNEGAEEKKLTAKSEVGTLQGSNTTQLLLWPCDKQEFSAVPWVPSLEPRTASPCAGPIVLQNTCPH